MVTELDQNPKMFIYTHQRLEKLSREITSLRESTLNNKIKVKIVRAMRRNDFT